MYCLAHDKMNFLVHINHGTWLLNVVSFNYYQEQDDQRKENLVMQVSSKYFSVHVTVKLCIGLRISQGQGLYELSYFDLKS